MKESDIMFESGDYWVGREKNCYTVFKNNITHAVNDSSYSKDVNGLSIAIYYAKFRDCVSRKIKNDMSTAESVALAEKLHKN